MANLLESQEAACGRSEAAEGSFLTDARLRLSRIRIENDLKSVLRQAAEISSKALNVARVATPWVTAPSRLPRS